MVIENIKISDNYVDKRIDTFITALYPYSRSKISKSIKNKGILVNNCEVKSSYKLKISDVVTIDTSYFDIKEILPENIFFKVFYEDEHILVLEKPNNLVVHPTESLRTNTLVNGLLYYFNKTSSDDLPGNDDRWFIVHRLDHQTTGIMVVAKTKFAYDKLVLMFKERTIEKKYIAIVRGRIKEKEFIIDKPISRDLKNRKKMAVNPEGKSSITEVRVIDTVDNFSVCEMLLKTGRTHQIRVHMSSIGYPIVDDPLYNNSKSLSQNGQLLHAYYLSFNHPIYNYKLKFISKLPDKFNSLKNKYNFDIRGIYE